MRGIEIARRLRFPASPPPWLPLASTRRSAPSPVQDACSGLSLAYSGSAVSGVTTAGSMLPACSFASALAASAPVAPRVRLAARDLSSRFLSPPGSPQVYPPDSPLGIVEPGATPVPTTHLCVKPGFRSLPGRFFVGASGSKLLDRLSSARLAVPFEPLGTNFNMNQFPTGVNGKTHFHRQLYLP